MFAHIIADRLEQRLGQTFLVENRPGAASVLGAAAVARAPADGYTLMVASGATMAVNVTLHKTLPYDPAADFTPIALPAGLPRAVWSRRRWRNRGVYRRTQRLAPAQGGAAIASQRLWPLHTEVGTFYHGVTTALVEWGSPRGVVRASDREPH